MAKFTIVTHGQEKDKDVWFANCYLYGDADRPIRVIVTGQALTELKNVLPLFSDVVAAAIDAAEEIGFTEEVVEVSTVSPFFRQMMVRFRQGEKDSLA